MSTWLSPLMGLRGGPEWLWSSLVAVQVLLGSPAERRLLSWPGSQLAFHWTPDLAPSFWKLLQWKQVCRSV